MRWGMRYMVTIIESTIFICIVMNFLFWSGRYFTFLPNTRIQYGSDCGLIRHSNGWMMAWSRIMDDDDDGCWKVGDDRRTWMWTRRQAENRLIRIENENNSCILNSPVARFFSTPPPVIPFCILYVLTYI